jgi:hypothetical protein
MKQTFHLVDSDRLGNLLSYAASLPQGVGWVATFEQMTAAQASTAAQRKTIRAWCTQLGKEQGTSQQRQYDLWKYHHVVPIMLRDEDIEGLEGLFNLVKSSGDKKIFQAFIDRIHIADLSVKQGSEAMNEFDMLWASRGIVFEYRRDYDIAMGR